MVLINFLINIEQEVKIITNKQIIKGKINPKKYLLNKKVDLTIQEVILNSSKIKELIIR